MGPKGPNVQLMLLFTERILSLGLNMTPFLENELLLAASARLQALTGLGIAPPDPMQEHGSGPDNRIRIVQGKHTWAFKVECRAMVDRVAMLHPIQNCLRAFPGEGLLVAPYLGPDLAKACLAMELPFMDAAGNAFLKGDGLYMLVTGQKPDKTRYPAEKTMRAFDRAGLRVVFALLAAPTPLAPSRFPPGLLVKNLPPAWRGSSNR